MYASSASILGYGSFDTVVIPYECKVRVYDDESRFCMNGHAMNTWSHDPTWLSAIQSGRVGSVRCTYISTPMYFRE